MAAFSPINLDYLEDLINYEPEGIQYKLEGKAKRVFELCIEQGHEELALKIFQKHSIKTGEYAKSDLAMAFGMALMAQQQSKKG